MAVLPFISNTVLNKKKGCKSTIIQIVQIDRAILLGNEDSRPYVTKSSHCHNVWQFLYSMLYRWSQTCMAQTPEPLSERVENSLRHNQERKTVRHVFHGSQLTTINNMIHGRRRPWSSLEKWNVNRTTKKK